MEIPKRNTETSWDQQKEKGNLPTRIFPQPRGSRLLPEDREKTRVKKNFFFKRKDFG